MAMVDIYLTGLETGRRVRFPLAPEEITVDTGAEILSWQVIRVGTIEMPRGRKPHRVSWRGMLPGQSRQAAIPTLLTAWRQPQDLIGDIAAFRDAGEPCQLLITETLINLAVYVVDFSHTYKGGFGDVEYSLSLTERRLLEARTTSEVLAMASASSTQPLQTLKRPVPATPKTYTVRPGDTLWAIAKRTLGDGSRWRDIYEANKATIGPDANLIQVGMTLRIA